MTTVNVINGPNLGRLGRREPQVYGSTTHDDLVAMIEEEACPSAQAFTSWAKSVTTGPSIFTSTVTVEPHSFEWAVAEASGPSSRPSRGMLPANSMIRLL